MAKTWIIVAENSRARVFETDRKNPQLREIRGFAHPEARLHEQELTSDLPGRTFDSAGQGRHAMEQDVSPKRHEAMQFAKQLAEYLIERRRHNDFDHLGLVAAPAMLGMLREKLDDETRKRVRFEIDKNLTRLPVQEIRAHLPTPLPH